MFPFQKMFLEYLRRFRKLNDNDYSILCLKKYVEWSFAEIGKIINLISCKTCCATVLHESWTIKYL